MARLNISFLAVFMFLALLTNAMPVKRSGESPDAGNVASNGAATQAAYDSLKSATEMFDTINQGVENDEAASKEAAPKAELPVHQVKEDNEDKEDIKPAPTEKTKTDKPSPAKASPSPSVNPSQKPQNILSNLPIIGSIAGGLPLPL